MATSNRKPVPYWIILAVIFTAFIGIATTAKADVSGDKSPSPEETAEAIAIVMAPELPYTFAGTMQIQSINATGSVVTMDDWLKHDFASFNKSFQQQGITIPAIKKAFDELALAYVCTNPALSGLIETGVDFVFPFILTDGLIWIVSVDECGSAS